MVRIRLRRTGRKKSPYYRIVVAEASPGTEVKVLAADGKPEKTDAAARILTVLQEDLK